MVVRIVNDGFLFLKHNLQMLPASAGQSMRRYDRKQHEGLKKRQGDYACQQIEKIKPVGGCPWWTAIQV
jgi:hypothetical protein